MPVTLTRFFTKLRTLPRERGGATIIEFAAVAAPFIALTLATLQTSLVFFAQQCLETTTEKVSRQIVTGSVQKAGMDREDFIQLTCANLPSFMTCGNLMVDVQTATSFDAIDTSSPVITYDSNGKIKDNGQFNPGAAQSIVVLRTMYLLPVIGGPLGFTMANVSGNRRLLVATSVFKSEPYAS